MFISKSKTKTWNNGKNIRATIFYSKQNTLGENIRRIREKAGLTQVKLGEMVNVSGVTVCYWEANRYCPGILDIKALCMALNVNYEDILGPLDA